MIKRQTTMGSRLKKWLPLLLAIAIGAGVALGGFLERNYRGAQGSIMRYLFQPSSKVQTILDLIDSEYVDSVNVNDITEDLIPKLLGELDPHSVYISAKALQMVNDQLDGSFSGIGVQFNIRRDTIMIVSVINGGPSEKLGIIAGDRIVTVDDSLFVGKDLTNEKVIQTLRGEKGTTVKLGIKRGSSDKLIEFNVIRGEVPVKSVEAAYMLNNEVGYVKVSRFGAETYKEFITAIVRLQYQGAQKLVVDLRENSGGYLNAAIAMVNEFLPAGRLIVYAKGKSYPIQQNLADGKGVFQQMPLEVLIDEWSASASEIFAGAMQDNDRAMIIGRRSFGKGLVGQQIPFKDGSAIRLTVARYYTPSGRCVQKPYVKGNAEAYEMEVFKRYEHGEDVSKDSIHFVDSLKYKTIGGRTVYGGGGIMPDIFIPKDTSLITPFIIKARSKTLMYNFALDYTDAHRKELEQFNDWKKLLDYLKKQPIIKTFVANAKKNGVYATAYEIRKSTPLLEQFLYSYIARSTKGDLFYYPIVNHDDPMIKKALEQFKQD